MGCDEREAFINGSCLDSDLLSKHRVCWHSPRSDHCTVRGLVRSRRDGEMSLGFRRIPAKSRTESRHLIVTSRHEPSLPPTSTTAYQYRQTDCVLCRHTFVTFPKFSPRPGHQLTWERENIKIWIICKKKLQSLEDYNSKKSDA